MKFKSDKTEFIDLPNEVWKDIQWAQGVLQISNAGRMRRISRNKKPLEVPQLLRISEWKGNKYYMVTINGKSQYYKGEYVRSDHFEESEFIELAPELKENTL